MGGRRCGEEIWAQRAASRVETGDTREILEQRGRVEKRSGAPGVLGLQQRAGGLGRRRCVGAMGRRVLRVDRAALDVSGKIGAAVSCVFFSSF